MSIQKALASPWTYFREGDQNNKVEFAMPEGAHNQMHHSGWEGGQAQIQPPAMSDLWQRQQSIQQKQCMP
jgi:hypothetical protein